MEYPHWTLSRGAITGDEPVSLTAAKLHLRVDANTEDTLITTLCTTAREHFEAFTNRAAVAGEWTLKLSAFPNGNIVLPVAVANLTVNSVSYIDSNGDTQTLANTAYRVLARTDASCEIAPVYGTRFPSTRSEQDAVTVVFTAGTETTKAAVIAGMLLLIGHLFEHRETIVTGTIATTLPLTTEALWTPYRVVIE